MIVDTSVLVAIVKREPDAESWERKLAEYARLRLSAASYLEAVMVIAGTERELDLSRFDRFLQEMRIEIEVVDEDQVRVAREAFLRFGKGRHPARLNYGDCFSYALAVVRDEPLLFKGYDFSKTDAPRILYGDTDESQVGS